MELSGDEPHFIKLAIHASRFGVRFSEWLDSDTIFIICFTNLANGSCVRSVLQNIGDSRI